MRHIQMAKKYSSDNDTSILKKDCFCEGKGNNTLCKLCQLNLCFI